MKHQGDKTRLLPFQLLPSVEPAKLLACMLASFFLGASLPTYAVDWSAVTGQEVKLFYPAQKSWEWLLTANEHAGAKKFREGKNCRACHDNEQQGMGAKLASGDKLSPASVSAHGGYLPVELKIAHDNERIYFRFQWQGSKPVAKPPQAKNAAEFATRVTLMLDDGGVKEAARAGCWGSCHDDAQGMASAPEGMSITKYLLASRSKVTRQGGGEHFKPAADLEKLLNQGAFLEYWQAQLLPGLPAQAIAGYVLDKRQVHTATMVSADAEYQQGVWTLVLSRKLSSPSPAYKAISAGKTYHFGVAIHDDFNRQRFHYVSFEYSFRLDTGPADFVVLGK